MREKGWNPDKSPDIMPSKDRKFKPFSAFFPCGGEGKTWRRA